MAKRLVVIGGVAGGASAAARARRLDENAEIIVLERGSFVSFANCGLPYHIGNIIKDRDDLILQTPASLKKRLGLDVRTLHEAVTITPGKKEVTVRDIQAKREYTLTYDKLILAPGAEAFKPPLPGIDSPRVFTLKTIPDMDAIIAHLEKNPVRHATVIGGGFIGIEAAENLRHRGLAVTLVEREKQVMPPLDAEMTTPLHQHLRFQGVDLRLGSQVSGIADAGGRLALQFSEGSPVETDMIILSIGVRPESKLARDAGLTVNTRGAIAVDRQMRTSDPDIFAVGDAVESFDRVTGDPSNVPLAGPANRQGRIAADNAMGAFPVEYRGTLGTWIVKLFDMTAAQTGLSEKQLNRIGKPYQKAYTHPASHAGYYPNAVPMSIKLLYSPDDGRILGAQIIGSDGVDKRIDVLATAMAAKMSVEDLVHLELAYAPPYGSAKDPVNMIGMVAENMRKGLYRPIHVDELPALDPQKHILLDVRTPGEHEAGHIPGSILIPVDSLRDRLDELPRDREIIVYCQVALRGYFAQRILTQKDFNARNLVGGYKTWTLYHEEALRASPAPRPIQETFCSSPVAPPTSGGETFELDACGLQCPGPLMKMRDRMEQLKAGQYLKVTATDPGFPPDVEAWCRRSGNKLVQTSGEKGRYSALIEKTASGLSPAISCPTQLAAGLQGKKKLTMVVFSGDLDRAYATFIIANGAAAMGLEVTLFFTFWGLNILRRKDAPAVGKSTIESMFGMMMPQGAEALGLSKMHFAGLGTAMMKHVMDQKKVAPLPELIATAKTAGVKLIACSMSMDVMGLKKSEFIDGVTEGGVAAYLDSAADSTINLFV
ncbi:MAG TPA: FAD-dependent oxidoreductase [Candidatus Ozemobacteraceae bacterium]|nr:FAD-dependent oxidoreductase [Candidatus Ozemobacteraceae bacterium]